MPFVPVPTDIPLLLFQIDRYCIGSYNCVAAWAHVPELVCKFCLRGPGVNDQIFGTSTRVCCERALTQSLDAAGCEPSLLSVAPPARVFR